LRQPGKARADFTPSGPLGGDAAEFQFRAGDHAAGQHGSWAPVAAGGVAIALATI